MNFGGFSPFSSQIYILNSIYDLLSGAVTPHYSNVFLQTFFSELFIVNSFRKTIWHKISREFGGIFFVFSFFLKFLSFLYNLLWGAVTPFCVNIFLQTFFWEVFIVNSFIKTTWHIISRGFWWIFFSFFLS